MERSGIADLPLHYGKAPPWLFERMVKLSGEISELIINEFGKLELIKRISNPYFFQAFSMVIGFDWHSSGTTTVLMGAMKEALDKKDLGIYIAGGKGKNAITTPNEIAEIAEIKGIEDSKTKILQYSSRMSAKVDNTLVQDGFSIYFHSIIFTENGEWAVIQQGMNEERRYARRYHWYGKNVSSYVNEPHSGIFSQVILENVLNLTSRKSEETRKFSLDIVREGPEKIKNLVVEGSGFKRLEYFSGIPYIEMPWKINWNVLREIYEFQPKNYEEMVALKGVGPATVRALAYIANIVYGAESSWEDPVKYSFALGGKDGVPRPVDRKSYDESIEFLKGMLEGIEAKERREALRRLRSIVP
ncbi:MAG: DUF763 domain-containing protein [Euryarchaeota archaeon]|nr:DUF763 domain-containing protein [Euryarchaeota archaeon]